MNKVQSFIQRIVGIKQEGSNDKPAGYLSFGEMYNYFQNAGQTELLKSYKSWAYAAISKRADTFAGMKLTLNKIVKKGIETTIEPVKSHPVLELLDKVNPYLNFPDLLKITQIYKDLAGNAFWWLIKSGNKIIEIWPYLRPDRMSVIPSATTFLEGYNYLVPDKGEYVKFQKDEIIHFKYPNPLDPYLGVAPMEACYLAFNTYLKSSEYNNRFFQNNARADFMLSFPNGLTEVEQKQIRAQWEARHRGEDHQHRFAILSGEAKMLNTNMTAKDMEFIEQMKFTRDEILAIFKVPKALLDPQELNYASAQVAKEVFSEEVIIPLMKDFVSSLNEFLLPQYNDDSLFFDFENPIEENPDIKYQRYTTLAQVGAIAPNEIREQEGLPPFEGGNNIYMSAMQVPVGGEVDMNQGKMFVGKIKEVEIKKKYNVLVKSKSEMAELKEQIKKEIVDNKFLAKKIKIMPKEEKKKSQRELFNEALWYEKMAKTNEDERKMRKLLREQFIRQEKKVLNSLRKKDFSFDFDIEDEEGIFVEIFEPYITNILKAYGEDAMQMIDMSGYDISSRAKNWISKNVNNFSTEINETTKGKIKDALQKSIEEGESIPEAGRRIKEVFSEANTSRTQTIARTEIQHASNYASVDAWKQSDVVKAKEWYTALDERTCEECESLSGQIINLDDEFNNEDEIFGNAEEPPAHVNCRCRLLPVIKTKSAVIQEIKKQEIEAKKNVEASKKLLAETKEVVQNIKEVITDEEPK